MQPDDIKDSSGLIPLDPVSGSAWIFGSVLGRTWRFSVTGTRDIDPFRDRDRGVIYCFWHENILPLAYIFRGVGVTAVVSASRDGDRATAVAQRWNHDTIRGSSSRGQVAVVRQCVRALEQGKNLVIIPDGPRGPRRRVKPGAAMIALLTNAPVFPALAVPNRAWRLNSWDRFVIPKPFTHITVEIRAPLHPSQFAEGDGRLEKFTACLQEALAP
jgi:lysophospholipid acyltransferase (LPLAT)-like uncharacterized protein